MQKINGVVTALFTPMFQDGRIDFRTLEAVVDYNAAHKVGVLSAGTTSESPTIHHEQEQVDQLVLSRAKEKVSVVIGAGTYDTEHSVELTRRAVGDGADATLHVMGYYNKPSQRGVMDYFSRVAEVDPTIPVIMYHIPGRGGAEYLPQTIVALAQRHPNINGLKEASGGDAAINSARSVRSLADRYNLDFAIMSGDDDLTFRMVTGLDIRGDGVISVMSNLLPHLYARLVESSREGSPEAQELNEALGHLNRIVGMKVRDYVEIDGDEHQITDTYRNPQSVKTAAYILGMTPELGFRSPMMQMPEDGVRQVGNALWQVFAATDGESFRPLQEFFRPTPSVSDRLMRFR